MANFTTYTEVKTYLGLANDDNQSLLERMIEAATQFIKTVLSRDITTASFTETRNGNDGTKMMLKNYPVTAVSSLVIDTVTIPLAANALGTGYLYDANAIYLLGYSFTKAFQNVTITYTAGYATVPADIEQCCIDLVALKFKEKDRVGMQSKSLANETVTYKLWDLTSEMKNMLKQYSRVIPI